MQPDQPVFLMSPPRRDWALRGKTNANSLGASPVNPVRAREEWTALANAIVDAGGEVLVVPPNPRENLTGLPYCAEAGEFWRDKDGAARFVLPSMAGEHRQPEADWIGGFMEGLGFKTHRLAVTWEAQGDGIRTHDGRVIHTFGSGRFRRTEARAYGEVAHLLSDEHIQLHFHADPWFHGNTFLNVYHGPVMPPRLGERDDRWRQMVLVCPDALLPGELERLTSFMGPNAEIHKITKRDSLKSDPNSVQVLQKVLASDTITKSTEQALRNLDLEVVRLPMDELYGKGGGAPVCLTNRLWGLKKEELPDHVLWSKQPSIESHTDV